MADVAGPQVLAPGVMKDGTVVQERIAFLIGRRVRVRLWWSDEGRAASPEGDLFEGTLLGCVPIGRDYFFVFSTGGDNPQRSIIKSAAVLQVTEA